MKIWSKIKSFRMDPEKLIRLLLKIFLFTFPFQLQILLYKGNYLTGLMNPFASVYLYFSEILIWLIFLSFGLFSWKKREDGAAGKSSFKFILLFFLTGFLLLDLFSVIQSTDRLLTWLLALKDLEIIGLFWILTEGILSKEEIVKWLVWGAVFQSFLGIIQFIRQSSLGLNFIGETVLAPNILNVAKIDFNGLKLLRAYGTFGHANILGGYLFCALAALSTVMKGKEWKYLPILVILLSGILVSFSRSAWLATLILGLFYFGRNLRKVNWKYWLLGVIGVLGVIFIFNLQGPVWTRISSIGDQAWSERVLFWDLGKRVIQENPLGVGRGNFTLNVAKEGGAGDLSPWLFQPSHNVFILTVAELGWAGGILMLGLVVWLLSSLKKHPELFSWVIGLIIIGMLDHYLMTNWTGQIIAAVSLILISLNLRQEAGIAEQKG